MNSFGRISGLLLPLFSLRARTDLGIGDFGSLEGLFPWMARARQKLLMVLPLLPTAPGDSSPYSTKSAFGLNPLFIDLARLTDAPTLTPQELAQVAAARAAPSVRYELVFPLKTALLERSFQRFEAQADPRRTAEFARFTQAHAAWLEDFALFTALSEANQRLPWWDWAPALAAREPRALAEARAR
jgi:4-alpha-glucanotransferase